MKGSGRLPAIDDLEVPEAAQEKLSAVVLDRSTCSAVVVMPLL